MEETVPQDDHGMPELSAPTGSLWASNQFAGGLIHELTSHVTACLALIDSIEKTIPPGLASGLVNQLEKSLRTCAGLIAQSKRIMENIVHNSTNFNEAIDFSVRLLRHAIHQNVQLELQLDPAVDALSVETKRLEMVLAVLLVRAGDAARCNGSITVETRYAHLDAPRRTRLATLQVGDYAALAITCNNDEDSAPGWEKWLSNESAGAPFVQSLLVAMGAQIDVARRPHLGATLTLYFPASHILPV